VETLPKPERPNAPDRKAAYHANVWFVVALAPVLLVAGIPKLLGREFIPNLSGSAKLWIALGLLAWAVAVIAGPYRSALRKSRT
jgi:hypothetical protein